ncbi:MAG: TetR/AcrR family transcriptional regulator [Planctomycetota bacterium]
MNPGPLKQFDRAEVLGKAMEVFWEHGYEGASLSDLLSHMGIGRQSLYDTFGDKRSLFLEALRLYQQAMLGPMLETLNAPRPAADNLRAIFDLWEAHAADENCRGCLAAKTIDEMGGADAEVEELVHTGMGAIESALAATIERARAEGDLTASVEPTELARTFLTLCQGMAVLSRSKSGAGYTRISINTMCRLLGLER